MTIVLRGYIVFVRGNSKYYRVHVQGEAPVQIDSWPDFLAAMRETALRLLKTNETVCISYEPPGSNEVSLKNGQIHINTLSPLGDLNESECKSYIYSGKRLPTYVE